MPLKAGFALQNSSISNFSILHYFVPFNCWSIVFLSVYQLFMKPKNTFQWIGWLSLSRAYALPLNFSDKTAAAW